MCPSKCSMFSSYAVGMPAFSHLSATQLHDGVKPTLQELEKFEATPEEVELEGNYDVS